MVVVLVHRSSVYKVHKELMEAARHCDRYDVVQLHSLKCMASLRLTAPTSESMVQSTFLFACSLKHSPTASRTSRQLPLTPVLLKSQTSHCQYPFPFPFPCLSTGAAKRSAFQKAYDVCVLARGADSLTAHIIMCMLEAY